MNIFAFSQFASLKCLRGGPLLLMLSLKRFWHKFMNTIYSTFFIVITLLADLSNPKYF